MLHLFRILTLIPISVNFKKVDYHLGYEIYNSILFKSEPPQLLRNYKVIHELHRPPAESIAS